MKRRLLCLCLVLCAFVSGAPARAAPPSEAQVDALLKTMDMQRTLDELFVQMESVGESMGQQMLGENATAEQRESLRAIMARQRESTRKMLTWENLGPIYRNVYLKLFSAEEIDAMTAFYSSDTGRSILRKTPQAVQLSMQEMQPMMQTMIAEMQKTLETELSRSGDGEHKGDHAH
jgi:uncharacterized protein